MVYEFTYLPRSKIARVQKINEIKQVWQELHERDDVETDIEHIISKEVKLFKKWVAEAQFQFLL